MTLVKIDHLRRIDQVVDYFGEPHRGASTTGGRTEAPPEIRVSRAGLERRPRA